MNSIGTDPPLRSVVRKAQNVDDKYPCAGFWNSGNSSISVAQLSAHERINEKHLDINCTCAFFLAMCTIPLQANDEIFRYSFLCEKI